MIAISQVNGKFCFNLVRSQIYFSLISSRICLGPYFHHKNFGRDQNKYVNEH